MELVSYRADIYTAREAVDEAMLLNDTLPIVLHVSDDVTLNELNNGTSFKSSDECVNSMNMIPCVMRGISEHDKANNDYGIGFVLLGDDMNIQYRYDLLSDTWKAM